MRLKVFFVINILIMTSFLFSGISLSSESIKHSNYKPSIVQNINITSGPRLSQVTTESIMISWWTDSPGNSIVYYGSTRDLGQNVSEDGGVSLHEVVLSNLEIDTSYYYQIETNGTRSPIYSFQTGPRFTSPIKFSVFGDNRPASDSIIQTQAFKDIVANINQSQPDLVFAGGDLINNGDALETNLNLLRSQWNAFFEVVDPNAHNIPWVYIIGNHDATQNTGTASFTEMVSQPKSPDPLERYFSFDYGPIHFIVLDTELSSYKIDGNQFTWLKNDLMASRQSLHTFVFMHKPYDSPYLPPRWTSERGLIVYPADAQKVLDLFNTYSVSALFVSHDHMFNYSYVGNQNLSQILTAAAGAPLYTLESEGGFYHHVDVMVNWTTVTMDVIASNGTKVSSPLAFYRLSVVAL